MTITPILKVDPYHDRVIREGRELVASINRRHTPVLEAALADGLVLQLGTMRTRCEGWTMTTLPMFSDGTHDADLKFYEIIARFPEHP